MAKSKYKKSVSGFSCPVCGRIASDKEIVRKTKPEFHADGNEDPHYEWKEYYKCSKCESFYYINNGT